MRRYNRKLTREEFQIELKKFKEEYDGNVIYYIINDKSKMRSKGRIYISLIVIKNNEPIDVTDRVAELLYKVTTATKGLKLEHPDFKDKYPITLSVKIMGELSLLRRKDGYCYEYESIFQTKG